MVLFSLISRISNKWVGLLAVSLFVFNPYLIGYYSSALPYSLAMFFSMLSIWFLVNKTEDNNKKIIYAIVLSSITASMAFLVRYNMLPLLIVLWFFIFLRWRKLRYLVYSVLTSFFVILILLIPFLRIDFQYTMIGILAMFGPLAPAFLLGEYSFTSAATQFWGSRLDVLVSVMTRYFHLWIIFIAWLFFVAKYILLKLKNRNDLVKYIKVVCKKNSILLLSALLTVLFFAAHFLSFGQPAFEIYSLYFAPFLIITVSLVVGRAYNFVKSESTPIVSSTFIYLVVVVVLLVPFSVGSFNYVDKISNPLHFSDSDINRVIIGANFLKSITTPDDLILTLDDPHHVFLAGRYEIPPLINKHFTYRESNNTEILKRFNFYNADMFMKWANEKATVIVYQRGILDERLNAIGDNRDFIIEDFKQILQDKFELIGSIENVYPRKYTSGISIMDVYKRKK